MGKEGVSPRAVKEKPTTEREMKQGSFRRNDVPLVMVVTVEERRIGKEA